MSKRPVIWAIFFEDADVPPEIFMGEGAEKAAKSTFKAMKDNWNCVLLREFDRG